MLGRMLFGRTSIVLVNFVIIAVVVCVVVLFMIINWKTHINFHMFLFFAHVPHQTELISEWPRGSNNIICGKVNVTFPDLEKRNLFTSLTGCEMSY